MNPDALRNSNLPWTINPASEITLSTSAATTTTIDTYQAPDLVINQTSDERLQEAVDRLRNISNMFFEVSPIRSTYYTPVSYTSVENPVEEEELPIPDVLKWKGEYDSVKDYEPGDVVFHGTRFWYAKKFVEALYYISGSRSPSLYTTLWAVLDADLFNKLLKNYGSEVTLDIQQETQRSIKV